MWSFPVHRLGGTEERRQQIELLWHGGVLCLQGEFSFIILTYYFILFNVIIFLFFFKVNFKVLRDELKGFH